MDRALNWDRVQRHRLLVHGTGLQRPRRKRPSRQAYAARDATIATRAGGGSKDVLIETDEFVQPTLITGPTAPPLATIQAGDGVVHFNYRRTARSIDARVRRGRLHRVRARARLDVCYRGLTRYYDEFPTPSAAAMNMDEAGRRDREQKAGLWQLHRRVPKAPARHDFFNGKRVKPYPGEDRILVPSVTVTEDQKPEMSAYGGHRPRGDRAP
jgi:2,3-bisphosphoglycerate-independent phosphoglycerate mutase